MSDLVRIRPIAETDWEALVEMEARAYDQLGLTEGREVLRSRADASPDLCFVLDVGARPAGYLLALPYPAFHYPSLEHTQPATAASASSPDNVHLHDIVITEGLRGRGLAQRLLHHLASTVRSRGYERISLVAVGRSRTFWSARGFTAHPRVRPTGYGTGAVYMSKAVPADRAATPEPADVPPSGPFAPTKRADARVPCP
ncbi:GNAT family N-acetyltransferase [Streptomyces sp. NPDC001002]